MVVEQLEINFSVKRTRISWVGFLSRTPKGTPVLRNMTPVGQYVQYQCSVGTCCLQLQKTLHTSTVRVRFSPRCRSLASRATKIILCKTLISLVVSCGAEAWTLTKKEGQAVLIFERKIFRRIYGYKYENGEWKSRTNRELEEMNKGENTAKWIKGQRAG